MVNKVLSTTSRRMPAKPLYLPFNALLAKMERILSFLEEKIGMKQIYTLLFALLSFAAFGQEEDYDQDRNNIRFGYTFSTPQQDFASTLNDNGLHGGYFEYLGAPIAKASFFKVGMGWSFSSAFRYHEPFSDYPFSQYIHIKTQSSFHSVYGIFSFSPSQSKKFHPYVDFQVGGLFNQIGTFIDGGATTDSDGDVQNNQTNLRRISYGAAQVGAKAGFDISLGEVTYLNLGVNVSTGTSMSVMSKYGSHIDQDYYIHYPVQKAVPTQVGLFAGFRF